MRSSVQAGSDAFRPRWMSSVLALVLIASLMSGAGVALARQQSVAHAATSQGQAIVNAAASQAGLPYCFDGGNQNGPTHGSGGSGCGGSTVGYDCSGLTMYAVYQATGIVLSHFTGSQGTDSRGTLIASQSNLLPGDLVFFGGGSMGGSEHVGVYAGLNSSGQPYMWDANDFNVPVQTHTLAWEEGGSGGLAFDGGMRFWSGGGGGGLSNGSFVSHAGYVYRIAGGAPIYVSTWSAVGGPQAATPLSDAQWASLPRYPADGTLVGTNAGYVYRFAGGAPIYVSTWSAIGGSQPSTAIDQAAIDHPDGAEPWSHVHAYPANGTLVGTNAGYVYRFAGGAPIYVSTWSAIGGSQPSTAIDQAAIDHPDGAEPWSHVHAYPANGTLVGTNAGYVYRFAGGAPIYVSTWSAIGGSQPSTAIDQAALDNADGVKPWNHVHHYPTNGTFLNGGQTGKVYIVNNGVPTYVPSWAPYGGPQPTTTVDQITIDRAGGVRPYNNLAAPSYTLTASTAGSGSGTVTGSGISCPGTCSKSFTSGTAVTLTAALASGSTFAGWSGACSGTGSCSVTMTAAKSVTATFTKTSSPSPSPTTSGSPSPTPSVTPTATSSASPTGSPTESPGPTPSPSKAPTAMTAGTSSPVEHGHRATLRANGLPADSTGHVSFTTAAGSRLCRATVTNGVAHCKTSKHLKVGRYRITARYSGDGYFRASTAHFRLRVTSS